MFCFRKLFLYFRFLDYLSISCLNFNYKFKFFLFGNIFVPQRQWRMARKRYRAVNSLIICIYCFKRRAGLINVQILRMSLCKELKRFKMICFFFNFSIELVSNDQFLFSMHAYMYNRNPYVRMFNELTRKKKKELILNKWIWIVHIWN